VTQEPELKQGQRLIRKAALAYFKDGKILMGRDNKNDEVFIMIGGKIEKGETPEQCLVREVKEEINTGVKSGSIKFLKEFFGPAHGHDQDEVLLSIRLYQADIIGEPSTSEEIVELDYFDSSTDQRHISEIGRAQIFPWLKTHGYIN
jgi:8-oxo-dGTP diphosphatase